MLYNELKDLEKAISDNSVKTKPLEQRKDKLFS